MSTNEAIQVRDLWEAVADRLRSEIISGRLAAGVRLVETELAAKYGVSRGPIREALRELTTEGIVLTLPRRGSVVCSLTQRDLEEVYAIRESLEVLALRLASERAADQELTAIRGKLTSIDVALQQDDSAAIIAADLDLHRAIVRASNSGRLLAIWEQLASQTVVLIGVAAAMDISLVKGAGGHHQAVVEALIKRDAERAGEVLARHFRKAERMLLAKLAQSPDTSAGLRGRSRAAMSPVPAPGGV
jgi:DNA-binding GntR family transcriptional regulator